MKRFRVLKSLSALLVVTAVMQPGALTACTACFGRSDSPLAEGMNWGILTLLCFIGFVLCSIATFFVYIAKRSASLKDPQNG